MVSPKRATGQAGGYPGAGVARRANLTPVGNESSAIELLAWHIAAGADEAIADSPGNRFAEAGRASPGRKQVAAGGPPGSVSPPGHRATAFTPPTSFTSPTARDAAQIAAACATFEDLVATIMAFDGCALKETATKTCVYDGNPAAPIMFIGEAPGAEEDRRGLPFVGRAGRLLDEMLAAIGLDRTSAYISNVLFWRPPGNRAPTPDEIATCLPFVERQVALIAPKVLVLVGGISAKAVFGINDGITRQRGTWRAYRPRGLEQSVPATAIFHPAFLLRKPLQKRETWRDLLEIKRRLVAAD